MAAPTPPGYALLLCLLPLTPCKVEYGLEGVVIGVPCRLGCSGIENVLELTRQQ
ncbi:hypothetical protein [Nostoc sp.]|uniref:hypothetical protein n=1 Tax=Nostoc sp. TaxID=1180 RepID=UPI002FFACC3E